MEMKPSTIIKRIATWFVRNRATLAVAESVTAGNIQAMLASISGCSEFLEGGIIAYSLRQKVNLLKVDHALAESVNCVSAEVASQMATGVRDLFGADIGLSITGYAEPDASRMIDLPQGYVAVCGSPQQCESNGTLFTPAFFRVDRSRTMAQRALARRALAHLLATLEAME